MSKFANLLIKFSLLLSPAVGPVAAASPASQSSKETAVKLFCKDNSPPRDFAPVLEASMGAFVGEPFTCRVRTTDPENDKILYSFEWFVVDARRQKLVKMDWGKQTFFPPRELKGMEVLCSSRAVDDKGAARDSYTSNKIVVGNRAPESAGISCPKFVLLDVFNKKGLSSDICEVDLFFDRDGDAPSLIHELDCGGGTINRMDLWQKSVGGVQTPCSVVVSAVDELGRRAPGNVRIPIVNRFHTEFSSWMYHGVAP